MWHHWHWHHVTPTTSTIAPLHSLGQDEQNESIMFNAVSGPVMALVSALVSHNANGIINAAWNGVQHVWSCDPTGIGVSIMWCQQCHQYHHWTPEVKMIQMRCNMNFLVTWHQWHHCWCQIMPLELLSASADNNGIINVTIEFLRQRWLKWGAPWAFGHVMPLALALVSHDMDGVICGTIAFLRSRWPN